MAVWRAPIADGTDPCTPGKCTLKAAVHTMQHSEGVPKAQLDLSENL